jgi:hypothetical protein
MKKAVDQKCNNIFFLIYAVHATHIIEIQICKSKYKSNHETMMLAEVDYNVLASADFSYK